MARSTAIGEHAGRARRRRIEPRAKPVCSSSEGKGRAKRQPSQGFSMVEMLASLVIFSIIAVMAVPMAQTYRDRQTEVILRDRLARIRSAIESHAATETTSLASPCAPGGGGTALPGDLDGDGVAGEDPAGDSDASGVSDDDLDGNLDEDGPPIYPPTLEALVEKGYLGAGDMKDDLGQPVTVDSQFPRDPTNLHEPSNIKTWVPLYVVRTFRFRCPGEAPGTPLHEIRYRGIYDVRSTSDGIGLSGIPLRSF
ncbi:MAG: type II secretion system protein [Candidatus Riflebacteria bacterium]|nr:type II secretion system protein [Candidatus Riflebacteria bacterium]